MGGCAMHLLGLFLLGGGLAALLGGGEMSSGHEADVGPAPK
jgi:hypothetical protein